MRREVRNLVVVGVRLGAISTGFPLSGALSFCRVAGYARAMRRLRDAVITGTGVFLPGEPIPNDRMEDFIGRIGGRASSVGQRALRWNGIATRHYALTPAGEALHSNASMSASAVMTALSDAGLGLESLQFLATATTQASCYRATAARFMANSAARRLRLRASNRSVSPP
jgi:hypothetical protein